MANAKNLTLHRALDLAAAACAEGLRMGFRVYDIDKTSGAPGRCPTLRLKGVHKQADGNYMKAVRVIPLINSGTALDFSVNSGPNAAAAKDWTSICGGEGCRRCENKADCAARWSRWGAI